MTRGLSVFTAAWLLTTAAAGGGPVPAGAGAAWSSGGSRTPACDDGVDNDGNGSIDYPDDPGCSSAEDPSEGHGDPVETRWARQVSLHFGDWGRGRVVVFGRLSRAEGGPTECVVGMPVALSRRTRTGWSSAGTVTTNEDGWYVAVRRDRPGRYRAVAPRRRADAADGSWAICRRDAVAKPHRHR
jgi:hypothetical protein